MLDKTNKQILICTVSSRLDKAISLAEKSFADIGIRSLISCQTFERLLLDTAEGDYQAYTLNYSATKGLSKNRNNALTLSLAEYVWIMDDDVEVLPVGGVEAFKTLENSNDDVITTCYVTDVNMLKKRYKKTPSKHNKLSIMKVTSFEIMCRRSSLMDNHIEFDVRFGLGAEFISGEENIFLADCLSSGLNVKYLPIKTAFHAGDTSGGNYEDISQLVAKGAIIRRIYGVLGFPFVIAFFIKRFKTREMSLYAAINAITYGYKGFFKIRNSKA